ncbi:oxidoreductase [Bacteroidales bacterium]|nr:oxidoreductase [Bacteroidales bacterium]
MNIGNKKIKFAIIGCGHIGKRHAEMICRDRQAQLTALCDILPAENLGLEAYKVPFFSSLDDLLAAQLDIDVLNICTPNGVHASLAIKALEAGLHVVVEKPMALNRHDAQEIILTAERMERRVFCVMQNRYSPPSLWMKEMVSSGRLGKIFFVQINCFWNRDERYYKQGNWHGTKELDGGTLFTQFSHFIDLMYWIFGDIVDVKSRFADFNHHHLTDFEDTGIINFEFVNGGIGVFNYSSSVWDKNYESSVTLIAENGSLKVGGQYMNAVEYCHVKDYIMPSLPPTNPGNDYGAYKGSAQNHHYVIENVIKSLKGYQDAVVTDPIDGLKVVEIIEKMYGEK